MSYFIEASFFLIKKDDSNSSYRKLLYQTFRALGSLLYKNGSNLNEKNLKYLFGIDKNLNPIDNEKSINLSEGILYLTINRIESNYKEQDDDIIKLNLILTQLIYNLTLPNTSTNNLYFYIEEKYKLKCVLLIMKILNANLMINPIEKLNSLNDQFQNLTIQSKKNDDYQSTFTRIFIKGLQALENLFLSSQKSVTKAQNSWLQLSSNEYQLGDIINLLKLLSFYGIKQTRPVFKNNEEVTNKQEPIGLDILESIEKFQEKPKIPDDQNDHDNQLTKDSDEKTVYNQSTTFHARKNDLKQQNKYKYNKKINQNNTKNNYIQTNDTNLNSCNTFDDLSYSNRCFKETQVPLIDLKFFNNSKEFKNYQTNDSELESSLNMSSSFYAEKLNAKVRISAISTLLAAFQSLDKRTVLSYWDLFLGRNERTNSNQCFNLIWSTCSDYSPKVRLIASQALAVLLECVRAFFSIAAVEDTLFNSHFQQSQANQNVSSFLPISSTITSLIKQLHKDLLITLCCSESFNLNLVSLLKCLQSLIKATPYQKLKPGLIYKLVNSLNMILNRKSTNFKKENLILINEIFNTFILILNTHHELAEVHLAFLSPLSQMNKLFQQNDDSNLTSKFEQLTNFKVPPIMQSRVTYFYDTNNSFSSKSSLNDSNTLSGQLTPLIEASIANNEVNKPWLIDFCIQNSIIEASKLQSGQQQMSIDCLEMLITMCRKSFALIRRDTCYDLICKLIIDNIDYKFLKNNEIYDQVKFKTLKLLEEFSRCLATDELRQLNNIDLNDCCKFWSSLLNTKLATELICDESRYLLVSAACDCFSAIGASTFELLPFQKRIYCLTNLLNLTRSQSSLIRSASVRGLGVYVTFASLKEDQAFLNDLSMSLLNLLSQDQNNLVRQKAAWSMSNLSEVLVENGDKLGKLFTDEFNLNTLIKLLNTSTNSCHKESDKIKSYLVRSLGNFINYASLIDNNSSNLESSISKAIEALCSCRNVKMLKVKWNLSHAIGVAMRRFNTWNLQITNPQWLTLFYDTLNELFTQSNNFKVRINACIAIMTINLKIEKSNYDIYIRLWASLIENFSKLNNGDENELNLEVQHKNTLIFQLCKLFTYLTKYLQRDYLKPLTESCFNSLKITNRKDDKIIHLNELRNFLTDYIDSIFKQIEINKLEVQFYNEALTQLHLLNSGEKSSIDEDCICLLNNLLKKPVLLIEKVKTESESSNNDIENDLELKSDFRKKFPFKQTYD